MTSQMDYRKDFETAAKLVAQYLSKHGLPSCYRRRLFPLDKIDDGHGVVCRMLPYRFAITGVPPQPLINWNDPVPFHEWAIRWD